MLVHGDCTGTLLITCFTENQTSWTDLAWMRWHNEVCKFALLKAKQNVFQLLLDIKFP